MRQETSVYTPAHNAQHSKLLLPQDEECGCTGGGEAPSIRQGYRLHGAVVPLVRLATHPIVRAIGACASDWHNMVCRPINRITRFTKYMRVRIMESGYWIPGLKLQWERFAPTTCVATCVSRLVGGHAVSQEIRTPILRTQTNQQAN